MKKLMLSLAVACVSAATAFAADAVDPTWFDAAVKSGMTSIQDGAWNKTTSGEGGVTYANNVITYKNMDEDLTFTVVDGKKQTLPGDEATVKTEVKFTAMAMEDFVDLTNNNPVAWADAKGGLTIIEESENTYAFYGLVDGTWQELAGDTTVTAESVISGNVAVPVEVKIWENNGRKISYKVNNAFIGDSEFGLTASGTGTTISQIAYRGNCEISSLTGDRADEMWNLTFSTIAELASAVLTLADNTTENISFDSETKLATYNCKAKNLPKSITVAPLAGYYFFASDTSKGSTDSVTAEATLSFTGSTTEPVAVSLPSGMTCEEPVAMVGTDAYKTLTAAVGAVANKGTVTLWKSANETFTIGDNKEVSFEEGDDRNAVIGGEITIAAGSWLNILSGKYVGTIVQNENVGLTLKGGYYSNAFEKADLQKVCEDGYFAETDSGTYAYVVKEGQVVTPTGDDAAKVPNGLVVADEIFPRSDMSAAEKTTYLADSAQNGLMRWQNFVLGLNVDEEVEKPVVAQASATATTLNLNIANVDVRTQTGYDVVLKKGTAELDGGALPLEAGEHTIKICLVNTTANGGEDIVVGTKTIGVKQPEVSKDEAGDVKLISVPYFDINAGAVTIDTLLNKASFTDGATLTTVKNNNYVSWKLDKGVWTYQKKDQSDENETTFPADEFVVKPGQGVWLSGVAENATFFQFGEVKADTAEFAAITPDEKAWNLLADPKGREKVTLEIINNPSVGDVVRIDSLSVVPQEYTYAGEGQWNTMQKNEKGRWSMVPVASTTEIDLGDTVWFVPTASSKATIQW